MALRVLAMKHFTEPSFDIDEELCRFLGYELLRPSWNMTSYDGRVRVDICWIFDKQMCCSSKIQNTIKQAVYTSLVDFYKWGSGNNNPTDV